MTLSLYAGQLNSMAMTRESSIQLSITLEDAELLTEQNGKAI